MNEQLSLEDQEIYDELSERLAQLRANPPRPRSRGSITAGPKQSKVKLHRALISSTKLAMKRLRKPYKVKKQGAPVSMDLELKAGIAQSVLIAPTNGEIEKLKLKVMNSPLAEDGNPLEEITLTLIQTSANRLRRVSENHGIPVNGASPDFGLLTVVEDESYDVATDVDTDLRITYLFRSI